MSQYIPALALSALTLAIAAPAVSADSRPLPNTQPVSIRFALEANSKALRCESAPVPLGKSGVATRLRDARWYAHDFALIGADGSLTPLQLDQNEWQHQSVALIDLETGTNGDASACAGNQQMRDTVTARVPSGHYTGLVFQIGVPGQLNHSNTVGAPPPLDISAMAWIWQAGRRFMKVEFTPEGGVQRAGSPARHWMLHLGSSGCTGNPASGEIVKCTASNRFEVKLAQFDTNRDMVVLDAAALLQDVDIGRDGGGAVGCMSAPDDPECMPVFRRLGIGTTTGPAFRAVAR